MNKRTKLLEAMRNNPRDWRIDDLISVAQQLAIECRNHGGSHHIFSYPGVEDDVSVPAHRPPKQALRMASATARDTGTGTHKDMGPSAVAVGYG